VPPQLLSDSDGGVTLQAAAVDPCACALLQVGDQREHVTAAAGVVAVGTRLPEHHRLTAEGQQVDLLSGAALGSGDHDAGVEDAGHGLCVV